MKLLNGTKGITFGSAWMYKALIRMLTFINIKVLYAFMAVCVIPVTLVFSSGARLAFRYFRDRRGYGWWRSLRATYVNHCLFGQTVIDKFAMYAGRKFRITYHARSIMMRSWPSPRLLSSSVPTSAAVRSWAIRSMWTSLAMYWSLVEKSRR